jgi:threonine dehydrogenase-like Zn-dependent dehydrogenase
VALAAEAGARVIAVARKASALEVARAMGAAETVVMDDHQRVIDEVATLTGGRLLRAGPRGHRRLLAARPVRVS